MSILMIIFYSFLALIGTALVVALFLRKSYVVERTIEIQKPSSVVFDYIRLLKNQNEYSKWALMDPAMTKTFEGVDGTVGFLSCWESTHKNVGKGAQEIKSIKEGERIDYELKFIKPFESIQQAYMTTIAINEDSTKVTWGFNGSMSYPTNLMVLFFNPEQMIGNDLATGLSNLKSKLEN